MICAICREYAKWGANGEVICPNNCKSGFHNEVIGIKGEEE
tara:strand:- start:4104 stop:4226 length:123 start_codon:yes stop_codon:yes gene_type:complete